MENSNLNVLVLGSGAREHALFWKICKSPLVRDVFCAPGNGGIPTDLRPLLNLSNFAGIAEFCKHESIGLVVIGPETPLCNGIVDYLAAQGIKTFGPNKVCAGLEGSKVAMKTHCQRLGIPTAEFDFSGAYSVSEKIIKRMGGELVLKADGLCAGKGVVVAKTKEEALRAAHDFQVKGKFGKASQRIVIERKLAGRECSVMVLCDGTENCIVMPVTRDYKRAEEGDLGENTGGMGAYAPLSDVKTELVDCIRNEIVVPTLRRMTEVGVPYHGVLYAGVMLTEEGPKLLEYNVRFGDPEAQVVLPLIESDLVPYFLASTRVGGFAGLPPLQHTGQGAVCTVIAVKGYPGHYEKGLPISDSPSDPDEKTLLFNAGAEWQDDGLVTSDGRVASAVGLAWTVKRAAELSRERAARFKFPDAWFRRDLGAE